MKVPVRPASATTTLLLVAVAGACSSTGSEDPCYAALADLDSDGTLTVDDCALALEGDATARRCEAEPDRWKTADDCASEDRLTSAGPALDGDLRIAHVGSPYAGAFLLLSSGSISTLTPPPQVNETSRGVASWTTSTVPGAWGHEIVSWTQAGRIAATDTTVWIDWNGDARVDASELRDLADLFGIRAPPDQALVRWSNGTPTVAVAAGGAVLAWRDVDGDRAVGGTEVLRFPGESLLGLGDRWLALRDSIWRSDDWVVQPSEIESAGIDSRCERVLAVNGRRPVCLYADRFLVDYSTTIASEPPLVRLPGDRLVHVELDFDLFVLFEAGNQRSNRIAWDDLNGDYVAQDSELVEIPGVRPVLTGAVRLRPGNSWAPPASILVADIVDVSLERPNPESTGAPTELLARRRRPADRYLGHVCSDEYRCAMNLACRVSGADTAARCVVQTQ